MSLKSKAALIMSSTVVASVAASLWITISYLERQYKATLFSQLSTLTGTLSADLDDKLTIAQNLLLASAPLVPPGALTDSTLAQRFLESQTGLLSVFDNGIELISGQGRRLAESPFVAVGRQGEDVSRREGARKTAETKKPYISNPYVSTHNPGRPAILFCAPLLDKSGNLKGILTGSLDVSAGNFLARMSSIRIGKTGYLFVISGNRTFVVHSDAKRVLKPTPPSGVNRVFDRAMEGFDDIGETTTSTGLAVIASFHHLRTVPWVLGASYPMAEAYAPLRRSEEYAVAAAAVGTLATLILVWLVMKRLMRPLGVLTQHVRELPGLSGDDRFLGVSTADEIGSLSEAFNRMLQTQDKQQAALHESETRLRTVVMNAPILLFAIDPDGAFTLAEGQGLHALGLKPGELVGRSFFELFAGYPAVLQDVRRALAGAAFKTVMEIGETAFQTIYTPLRGEFGELAGAIGIATDVTAQRKLELEQQKLAAVVEMSHEFIGIATLTGQVIYLNDSAMSLVGIENLDEARQKTIFDFFPESHLAEARNELYPALIEKGFWSGESRFRHFRTDDAIDVEIAAFQIRDAVGSPRYIATVTRDMTERRRADAEKAKLESQLRQAQKMESIGRLAGGVAHDFNNMLTVILGYSALLKSQFPPGDSRLGQIEEIEKAGTRSQEITSQLLAFSRRQVIAPKTVNLNDLVAGMEKPLGRLIGEDVELRFIPDPNLRQVLLDPSQVDQILFNLSANARDAMPHGGKLTIETANCNISEEYCRGHAGFAPGEYVLLAVSDNGQGMDSQTLSQIFEPFFTTKGVGRGTGLGLATVHGIVTQNGGFVNVYSELEQGTTFRIYFPTSAERKETGQRVAPAPLEAGSGTILLVEDDEIVRRMTAVLLESLGYTPLVAASPEEAISLCGNADTPIDLLLTDVVMPGMKGTELRDRVLAERPGMRVLFMSGYTANVIVHHGVLKEGVQFIQKPFGIRDLAAKLAEVLGSR